jgi:hypothetical protein
MVETMDTFRLNFIDIDESFNIPVPDTDFSGFMVVRAPKGTTEALYFPKSSQTQIESMLGIATADWGDLQEAIDYNRSFGLYISAPPGTSSTYSSYFGGSYFTKRGIFPFYQVDDKEAPNFLTLLTVGAEDVAYLHSATGTNNAQVQVVLADPTVQGSVNSLSITGVDPLILENLNGLVFKYWGNPSYIANPVATEYLLTVAGNNLVVENPDGTGPVVVGTVNGSTLVISGTSFPSSFLYLDFNALSPVAPFQTTLTGVTGWEVNGQTLYVAALQAALVGTLDWAVNVEPDTYFYIAQKSQTEKTTQVTLSAFGYDKYSYSLALNCLVNVNVQPGVILYPSVADTGNAYGLYVVFNSNNALGPSGIYQSNGTGTAPTNVTNNYLTKYVRVLGSAVGRDQSGNILTTEGTLAASYVNQIYYITTAGALVPAVVGTGVAPKANYNYNVITFSLAEQVYPGSLTSGGSFTGSLDPAGLDTSGAGWYIQDLLPEDAFSFVDIYVLRTLDADVDAVTGFFTGTRLVDPFNGASSVTVSLKGQRYVSKVVADLVAGGSVGSAPVQDFVAALSTGWTEAAKNAYDAATVFMEPTGIEVLKDQMSALRATNHKMSTFIAPRLLAASEAANPASIVVNDRGTGFAQYVNQFQRKDTYSGKKWWANLMGSVGACLSTIMTLRQGAWAPMYTNVAGGLGGQLDVSVLKAMYEFDADAQKTLDGIGLNPISLTSSYGAMILSQKTTQDPDNLTDWSYLAHSMAFDLFKREIRENVMIPQIGKPNDSYWQGLRQTQAEAILNRRLTGSDPAWAAGQVEIASVNTDAIKAARDFMIRITVKVNIFSETVTLTFVNVGQTSTVS